MFYEELAIELLMIRANLLQVTAHQKVSKMMQGESFVLNYLYANEGTAYPKVLSKKLSVSTARIASLLNHMDEKGLVTRSPDPTDSRQVIVRITPEGIDHINQIRTDVVEHTAQVLEKLGEKDAQEYIRIQKKIYQLYSE